MIVATIQSAEVTSQIGNYLNRNVDIPQDSRTVQASLSPSLTEGDKPSRGTGIVDMG
ncbi:MAG: hypothetical protein ACYS32_15680 [Planctomycetota bacterium]|jgi:hypothetical protein